VIIWHEKNNCLRFVRSVARMIVYKTKTKKLGGTSYREVIKKARAIFHNIEKRSKRNAYLRSAYFKKEKVFFGMFWTHLNQKPKKNRVRRLKLLSCAVDLIEHSRNKPISKLNPNNTKELLHRFGGITSEGELFYVQIKENLRTKRKDFMSVFPAE